MPIELGHAAEATPVPIAGDAAVAIRGVADGRLLPLLILDSSNRPDIEDAIRAHRDLGPGDVRSCWAAVSRFSSGRLRLVLEMVKPSRCVVILEFDLVRQGGLVDQIVQSQGLYIQAGRPGDRLRNTLDRERILVEVPSREFRPLWESMMRKALLKDFRRHGLSRRNARDATETFIAQWRDLTSKRMSSEYDEDG